MEKIENGVYVRKFFFFNKMNNPIWKRSFELTKRNIFTEAKWLHKRSFPDGKYSFGTKRK